MLESFSAQAMQIVDDAREIAKKNGSNVVGSEHLLLSMYATDDSICRFLLQEQNISYSDLENTIEKITIIHKTVNEEISFTDKFQEIVLKAEKIMEKTKSDYVFEEHLFYSLLIDDANVACEMLKILDLDTNVLINDIEDIFNFGDTSINEPSYPFLINLTTKSLVHPFISRSNYIERINYILNKKQKNNPLLIGNAGVGKTAIIEGLAKVRNVNTIYQLDLGGAIAGTKYRGELEEKIYKVMNFIKENKAILFIDEIHNIVGAGSNDGSLDIANILKPYLSRTDFAVIGATTLDEYYRFFEKDKALMRRFQTVFIDEPNEKETLKILKNIKSTYETYHQFKINNYQLNKIINLTKIYLPNKNFPDKAIDVLDEIGSRYQEGKNISSILDEVIYNQSNLNIVKINKLRQLKLHYDEFKVIYAKFYFRLEETENMGIVKVNNDFEPKLLLEDLKKVFNFKQEMYLEIDFEEYHDSTMINNLLGSNKGYIAYDEGGIFTEHILKYPLSVVYLKNFDLANELIKNTLNKIMNKKIYIDRKGRKINLQNTLFLINEENKKKLIGFLNEKKSIQEVNLLSKKDDLRKHYEKILKEHQIIIKNIEEFATSDIKKIIYNLLYEGKGTYILKQNLTFVKQK